MKRESGKKLFTRKLSILTLALALGFVLCACGEESGGRSSGRGKESRAGGVQGGGKEDDFFGQENQGELQADSQGSGYGESSEESPVSDFLYIIENGEARITSYGGRDTDIVVPSRIENCPVTVIGDAFGGRERGGHIERVVLPEGVREIESLAFSDCISLKEVVIPDTVEKIGGSAFLGCKSLTGVKLPNGVSDIGRSAFSGCISLTSFDFPAGVTEIPEMILHECTSLRSVTIPDGVTEIGDVAFSGCANLGSLSLPGTVEKVGDNAFAGCENIVVAYDGGEYGYDRLDYLHAAINRPSGGFAGRYRVADGEEPWWCFGDLDITRDDDGSF